jgi:hypothetical protein
MLEGGGLMCEEEPDQFPRFYFKTILTFFLIGVFMNVSVMDFSAELTIWRCPA